MNKLNKNTQAYKNKLKYIGKYNKENTRVIGLQFNKINDIDILNKLDSVKNKTDYVRQLIFQDIIKNKD